MWRWQLKEKYIIVARLAWSLVALGIISGVGEGGTKLSQRRDMLQSATKFYTSGEWPINCDFFVNRIIISPLWPHFSGATSGDNVFKLKGILNIANNKLPEKIKWRKCSISYLNFLNYFWIQPSEEGLIGSNTTRLWSKQVTTPEMRQSYFFIHLQGLNAIQLLHKSLTKIMKFNHINKHGRRTVIVKSFRSHDS